MALRRCEQERSKEREVNKLLNIISGGAGTGKTFEMMNRIEAAVKNNKDVLVIIPDQFSFEFDKDLYERLGAVLFNRVNVLSFARLSKEIFIRCGGVKGRYADDIVKSVMMFRAISSLSERGDLCFFNKQAARINFVDSALDVVKELTVNGISPEELSEKCGADPKNSVMEKTADISRIYLEYSRLLSEKGYKDGESDISEAAKKAAASGSFKGKSVFIDEFKSFTADELSMLDAIIADSEELTICLTMEDGEEYSVFETVRKTFNRLKRSAANSAVKVHIDKMSEQHRFNAPELAFFSGNVLRNVREKFDEKCDALKIYRAPDFYGEGDFVCSEIRRLVMEEGMKYNEIAVLCRQKEIYSSVMESAFERYDIPFYTDENGSAAHKSLFVFVKTALKLASDENASSEDWLRYMKTGIPGLSQEEISAAEEHCYKWSVTGKMWSEAFLNDDGGAAEEVRKKVTEPIFALREACKDTDGKGICFAILDFFDKTGVTDNISAIYDGCVTKDAAALSSVRELKQLWELLCTLLETLSKALEDIQISLEGFSGIFSSAVGRAKLSAPPQTLDCVRFAALHTARLSNVKAAFVIGANEGVIPYAAKNSGLFSDRDRLVLENMGIDLSGNSQDKLSEERFAAYSALSEASDRLYITYACSDIPGNALYPSVVTDQAEDMFGKDIVYDPERCGLLSFCTTPEAAYYQYVQNYRREDPDSASLLAALGNIPEYSERIRYLKNVENSSGHRLSPGTGEKIFGKNMHFSASRFEDHSSCPFMYYCKKGLDIYAPRKVELDKPSRGTAIHYCLCGFIKKFGKDVFSSMSREEISANVKKLLDSYYNSDAVGGDYGKTKRYKAAFSRLSDTITDILSRMAEEFAQNEFMPERFEYTLGRGGDEGPLELVTDSGIKIYFDGCIDRVDVFQKGGKKYIRVIDYKSGMKEFRFTDLLYGANMQMLLYIFALTDSSRKGSYSGDIPAGVLYMPAKDAVPTLDRNSISSEEAVDKTYKMMGFVLDDDSVVKAMEKECGGKFIPVRKTNNGYDRFSKLVTEKQFENLRKYSYRLLKETAEELYSGKIDASPLVLNKNYLICDHCDYYSICGEYPPKKIRVPPENAEELIEKIKNGDDENGSDR